MLDIFKKQFGDYRSTAEKAIAQLSDAEINRVPAEGTNSIAVVMRHISGNLRSRFTDFLSSDGEKPWRDRESEFDCDHYSRHDLQQAWEAGWHTLEAELGRLTEEDLGRSVVIRGQEMSVAAALTRSVAHISYHVGQIVLLARIWKAGDWEWISIPRGKSEEFNRRLMG